MANKESLFEVYNLLVDILAHDYGYHSHPRQFKQKIECAADRVRSFIHENKLI